MPPATARGQVLDALRRIRAAAASGGSQEQPLSDALRSQIAALPKEVHDVLSRVGHSGSADGPAFGPSVYVGNGRVLTRTEDGLRLFLLSEEMVVTPIVLLEGVWERPTGQALLDSLKPGMTFVDVGAQMGYFTCLGGRAVMPGGKLFAFEADSTLMEIVTDNTALNWLFTDVHVENVAIMDRPGSVELHRRRKYKANSSIGAMGDVASIFDDYETVSVPAISLDDRLRDEPRVDLIKIDVEGAETFVFAGMEELVARHRDLIVMAEWSPGQIEAAGANPADFVDWIERHGFAIDLLADERQRLSPADLGNVSHGMLFLRRDATA